LNLSQNTLFSNTLTRILGLTFTLLIQRITCLQKVSILSSVKAANLVVIIGLRINEIDASIGRSSCVEVKINIV
jgi:hypothetical protein